MIRREFNEGRMNCKAFWERKRLHMPSDLCIVSKAPGSKKAAEDECHKPARQQNTRIKIEEERQELWTMTKAANINQRIKDHWD